MTTPLAKLYYGLTGLYGGVLGGFNIVTGSYVVDSNVVAGQGADFVIACDFSASGSIILPVGSITQNRVLAIYDAAGTANVDPIKFVSGTINGQSNYQISSSYGSVIIFSTSGFGSTWNVLAKF